MIMIDLKSSLHAPRLNLPNSLIMIDSKRTEALKLSTLVCLCRSLQVLAHCSLCHLHLFDATYICSSEYPVLTQIQGLPLQYTMLAFSGLLRCLGLPVAKDICKCHQLQLHELDLRLDAQVCRRPVGAGVQVNALGRPAPPLAGS